MAGRVTMLAGAVLLALGLAACSGEGDGDAADASGAGADQVSDQVPGEGADQGSGQVQEGGHCSSLGGVVPAGYDVLDCDSGWTSVRLAGSSIKYLYEWTGDGWEPLERFSGPDKQNACYARDDMRAKGVPADFFEDGELR